MNQQFAIPVAVFDSSVLVPRWSRLSLQRALESGDFPFTAAWSEWIIAETWRVLSWRWIVQTGRTDETERRRLTRSANQMLRALIPVMTLVTTRDFQGEPPWPGIRDTDDIPIWETAVVAGAHYVVSHNTSDFPPLVDGRHLHAGIEYLTAIEFIEQVLRVDAADLYGVPLPSGGPIRSHRFT